MPKPPESLIFDLDNTLYDYHKPHKISLGKTLQFFSRQFELDLNNSQLIFEKARHQIHISLAGQAASHNRILYFQKMLELIDVNSMQYAFQLYTIYWDSFLEEMQLFQHVEEALSLARKKKIKMCILTDLTAQIQFRKIAKTGIAKYFDFLITSEEVGHEKPHPVMFEKALEKLKTAKGNALMIGDNWNSDIAGAEAFGLQSIWLNHENEKRSIPSGVTAVNDFSGILTIMNEWN